MESSSLKFSFEPRPRPPEITILALVSSGRSDLDRASLANFEVPGSAAAAIFSIAALPPSAAAAKAVVRTVMTFLAPLGACKVSVALPA